MSQSGAAHSRLDSALTAGGHLAPGMLHPRPLHIRATPATFLRRLRLERQGYATVTGLTGLRAGVRPGRRRSGEEAQVGKCQEGWHPGKEAQVRECPGGKAPMPASLSPHSSLNRIVCKSQNVSGLGRGADPHGKASHQRGAYPVFQSAPSQPASMLPRGIHLT